MAKPSSLSLAATFDTAIIRFVALKYWSKLTTKASDLFAPSSFGHLLISTDPVVHLGQPSTVASRKSSSVFSAQ